MNKKILTALILNIIVVVATTAIVVSGFFFKSDNPLIHKGFDAFMFFTTDSNVLAAISSLVLIPFEIQILRGKRDKLPHAALVFKFVGMVSVMLTFTTVMILLLPVYGPAFLLLGTAFYMHLAGPITALVTFLFLETDSEIKLSESFLALIPCVIYGAVYLTQVVLIGKANGGWDDFYTFNRGGFWYITVSILLSVTYLIAFITRMIHNKMVKKQISE